MIPQHAPAAQHQPPAQHPPLASWGSRAKAYAIDSLVLLVPALLLFAFCIGPALGNDVDSGEADLGLFFGVVAFLVSMLVVGVIWTLHMLLMMIRKGERNG